jgi:hypothetical protein
MYDIKFHKNVYVVGKYQTDSQTKDETCWYRNESKLSKMVMSMKKKIALKRSN